MSDKRETRIESYEQALRVLDGRKAHWLMLAAGDYQAKLVASANRQQVTLQYRQAGSWNPGLRYRPGQPVEIVPEFTDDGNLSWVINKVGPARMSVKGSKGSYVVHTASGEYAPLTAGLGVTHDGHLSIVSEKAISRLAAAGDFGTLLHEELHWQQWDEDVDDLTLLVVPKTVREAQQVGFYGQVTDRVQSVLRRQQMLDAWEPEGWWKGSNERELRVRHEEVVGQAQRQLNEIGGVGYMQYSDIESIRAEVAARVAESVERARLSERFWSQIESGRVVA